MINDELETKNIAVQCGKIQNIKWPSIREFNLTLGKKKIVEFIKTWSLGNKWLYYFPEPFQIEKKCSDYYIYTVSLTFLLLFWLTLLHCGLKLINCRILKISKDKKLSHIMSRMKSLNCNLKIYSL